MDNLVDLSNPEMRRNDQPLYEYACHEGNYGLYNILAGAQANPEANVLTTEEVIVSPGKAGGFSCEPLKAA